MLPPISSRVSNFDYMTHVEWMAVKKWPHKEAHQLIYSIYGISNPLLGISDLFFVSDFSYDLSTSFFEIKACFQYFMWNMSDSQSIFDNSLSISIMLMQLVNFSFQSVSDFWVPHISINMVAMNTRFNFEPLFCHLK